MIRLLLAGLLCLLTSRTLAQTSVATPPQQPFKLVRPTYFLGEHARVVRFARTASITGVVSAGLLLGGAITMASVRDHKSERFTMSTQLGLTAVAAPLVALSAFLVRKRTHVQGYPRLARVGWAAYSAAIVTGVTELYWVLHDQRTEPSMTVLQGVFAALSVLPHAFDAYACARQARLRSLRLAVTPFSLRATF